MKFLRLPENNFHRIIFIGEVHGIKENIEFLKALSLRLKNLRKKIEIILLLEWPVSLEKKINQFIEKKIDFLAIKKAICETSASIDGRIGLEHLRFLEQINKITSHKVFCFSDEETNNWQKREENMAFYARHIINRLELKSCHYHIYLILTGNLHARKTLFRINNKPYRPLASMIKPNTSIILRYKRGLFYNLGIREFKFKDNSQNTTNELRRSRSRFYDYEYIISKATPITPLSS